ncbi:LAMI_0D10748g1_1 [Lachancea mirantina]|uniref:LAMI_0D10748g1_1 n=1 Tax=Lachancea mirantina TaxID=1230905 RepID=A0A1G4JES2_9SACH|nr:LAMI_0D10748g1_1 [Lachancea mirantina]
MLLLAGIIFVLAVAVVSVVFPPWNFPKNIPTVPFYVTFLPTFFDLDQEDIFARYLKKPMEEYGAVKIYFGSRWNILISRPEYLAQIFKDEDTFAKSGNQKKIPYSVIAAYTGENVISAHGAIWRVFRRTLTPGLQFFDDEPMIKNADTFCEIIKSQIDTATENDTCKSDGNDLKEKPIEKNFKAALVMPELLQKLAMANIAQVVLGFDVGTLSDKNSVIHQALKNVKRQIFRPLFLNFPFLDLLPIPSRTKARKDVEHFRTLLVDEVEHNIVTNYRFEQTSFAVSDLIRTYNREEITRNQLINNIVIMMVAGHENPQLLMTSCLYMLAKSKDDWQVKIRNEVEANTGSLAELPCLNSFIFECVRLYPPLSQIINRETSKTCLLGNNIVIPKGVYVGYNVYGTGRYPAAWGIDANQFMPQRWGDKIENIMNEWRHRKNTCAMSAFHGGRRACLGEKLALNEVRITLAAMLKTFQWQFAPDWVEKMTPAGPLCPLNLKLEFSLRKGHEME